jgi:hypothetical protein
MEIRKQGNFYLLYCFSKCFAGMKSEIVIV